jgi:hypothetical protein
MVALLLRGMQDLCKHFPLLFTSGIVRAGLMWNVILVVCVVKLTRCWFFPSENYVVLSRHILYPTRYVTIMPKKRSFGGRLLHLL